MVTYYVKKREKSRVLVAKKYKSVPIILKGFRACRKFNYGRAENESEVGAGDRSCVDASAESC